MLYLGHIKHKLQFMERVGAMAINKEMFYYPFFPDITGYGRNMKVLRESEDRGLHSGELFTRIFNVNPVPMAVYKIRDGRFIEVNDSFLRITGYRREEVIGRRALDLNLWANREEGVKISRLIPEHGTVINMEISCRKKTGRGWAGLMSADIFDYGGEQCVLVAVNDITELKQLEKEVARLGKLNLVGEMAAGIGHEIRNPMTTVRGFLQILGSKDGYIQYKEYFNLMIDELDRVDFIIKNLMLMAKNKSVDLKSRKLNAIVKDLYPLILADAIINGKNVSLELGDIPDLPLDEEQIRRLISNFTANGLEAMPSGGTLTIKTFKEGEQVVLAVRDEGKGIMPDIMEKIGTPFFTTKDQGAGLGLAVCYSIAARHNAVVEVKTGSKGTTFFVRFNL